jgi:Holliday junction resolvase RusA-like endonuclease
VKPEKPFEGPVAVWMDAYMPIPGMSKKRLELAKAGEIRPITRPDVKNIFTGVEDALKSIIWKDDSQVVVARITKFYSEVPRVEVVVKEL